jgi:hypothetical protein
VRIIGASATSKSEKKFKSSSEHGRANESIITLSLIMSLPARKEKKKLVDVQFATALEPCSESR